MDDTNDAADAVSYLLAHMPPQHPNVRCTTNPVRMKISNAPRTHSYVREVLEWDDLIKSLFQPLGCGFMLDEHLQAVQNKNHDDRLFWFNSFVDQIVTDRYRQFVVDKIVEPCFESMRLPSDIQRTSDIPGEISKHIAGYNEVWQPSIIFLDVDEANTNNGSYYEVQHARCEYEHIGQIQQRRIPVYRINQGQIQHWFNLHLSSSIDYMSYMSYTTTHVTGQNNQLTINFTDVNLFQQQLHQAGAFQSMASQMPMIYSLTTNTHKLRSTFHGAR